MRVTLYVGDLSNRSFTPLNPEEWRRTNVRFGAISAPGSYGGSWPGRSR